MAHIEGNVAKVAKNELENNLGESVITNDNRLDSEYVETKQIGK